MSTKHQNTGVVIDTDPAIHTCTCGYRGTVSEFAKHFEIHEKRATCPCDKFGDKFGCGDGYSHCGGFAGNKGNRNITELRAWLCKVLKPCTQGDKEYQDPKGAVCYGPPQVTASVYMHDTPDKIELQFHGWALVLLADGTWYPLDTSGG